MKRSELHALAWSEPVTKLAQRAGLSDIGFAKLCKRYDVPVPPRGYWARAAAGQSVEREPLPNPQDDRDIPRLSVFDAPGAPTADHAEVDEWLIPGLLKRNRPTTVRLKERPPAPANGSSPAWPYEMSGGSIANAPPSTKEKHFPPQDYESRAQASTATRRAETQHEVFEVNWARRAEYEKALALSATHAQHQTLASMLRTVELFAPHVPVGAASVLQAWVAAVRDEMATADPLAQLVADSISIAVNSNRPAWWPKQ